MLDSSRHQLRLSRARRKHEYQQAGAHRSPNCFPESKPNPRIPCSHSTVDALRPRQLTTKRSFTSKLLGRIRRPESQQQRMQRVMARRAVGPLAHYGVSVGACLGGSQFEAALWKRKGRQLRPGGTWPLGV